MKVRKDNILETQPVNFGFKIEGYDYISLSYTGDNVTQIIYKSGGAGGTTVATLDLTYTGSNVDTITKS